MIQQTLRKWTLIIVTILCCTYAVLTADPSANSTKYIKENPIVIRTVAKNYENPSIEGYHICVKSRDVCLNKCSTFDEACKKTCPICPILVDQEVLVQGINDTLYRSPITSKINQTNIIRLVNEISNIIDTNFGNITTKNQNNVNIYQNRTSRTGGRFGLGYSESGPCCHVIEPRRCKSNAFSSEPICQHRRQRSCGIHCISRVMRAKRVVSCNEGTINDCSQEMEYFPLRRRPGCRYSNAFPFISCPKRHVRTTSCSYCYRLPVMYLMRGQISNGCASCFSRSSRFSNILYRPPLPPPTPYYGGYGVPMYPPSYHPGFSGSWQVEDGLDEEIDFLESPGSGWKVEERKCMNEDGSITENCSNESSNEQAVNSADNNEETNYSEDDLDDDSDLDYE